MSIAAIETSPRARFLEYCARGELAYQVSQSTGAAFFYPRVAEPGTGNTDLEWRLSSGRGVVYASTTVRPRGEQPHNVSIVELDEGFKMMSTVTGIEPDSVRIGMPVQVTMSHVNGSQDLLPTFEPVREGEES